MTPIACHVVLRLTDSRVIAPSRALRRTVSRCIARVAEGFPLAAFRIADTHIHLVVCCDAATAAELARRIEISLQRTLNFGTAFVPAWVRRVEDQRHLESAFRYTLDQDRHHGTHVDPLHDGSNLPDLLGMRTLAPYTIRTVREFLPRVGRDDLLGILGVQDLTEAVGPLSLVPEAACAAFGISNLAGHSAAAYDARHAAVKAVGEGHPQRKVAALLGVSRHTVRRLLESPSDPATERAVRLQLGARLALAATGQIVSADATAIFPQPRPH